MIVTSPCLQVGLSTLSFASCSYSVRLHYLPLPLLCFSVSPPLLGLLLLGFLSFLCGIEECRKVRSMLLASHFASFQVVSFLFFLFRFIFLFLSPPLLGVLLGFFSRLCGIEECRMVCIRIACAVLPFVASQRSGSFQRPSSILSFRYP